jgi:hypothetical protein
MSHLLLSHLSSVNNDPAMVMNLFGQTECKTKFAIASRDRDTEGRFADYSLASGYRQYFWKGLHLEFSQTTGLGVLQNHVTTGKTYNSFDWLVSGYIGYKFEFAKKKLYVLPQFGVAGVIYKSNPWPIYEDKTLTKQVGESPFMLGSLRFGYNF